VWQNIAGNHCIGRQKKIAFSYSDPEGSFGENWTTLNPCLAVRRALRFKRGERKCSCIRGQILAACAWCRLSFSMIRVFVDIILFVIHLYSCGFHKSFPESFVGLISVCLNGTDYFPDCSGSSSTIWSFLSKL